MNVKQMREDFHELLANHRACSGKQQERWESTGQLIAAACQDTKILNADLRSEIKVLEQKLDDYIRWAKNGGKDNVG